MNYTKPAIEAIGNARTLVLGTAPKPEPSTPDSYPSLETHSITAYEADE
jgi:hypothetical protein